jgi:hypothetical protein
VQFEREKIHVWVKELRGTSFGGANLDGIFDSSAPTTCDELDIARRDGVGLRSSGVLCAFIGNRPKPLQGNEQYLPFFPRF